MKGRFQETQIHFINPSATSDRMEKFRLAFCSMIKNHQPLPMITVATVGYEGLTLPDFLALLKRCKVSRIIDVREMPISRKPGFGKTAMSRALDSEGIGYVHFPELGCPKEVRNVYRQTHDWAWYTVHFKRYLEGQEEALHAVRKTVESERCALLCFEKDFNFCHRTYVAEKLADLSDEPFRIEHLTGPIKERVVVRTPVLI